MRKVAQNRNATSLHLLGFDHEKLTYFSCARSRFSPGERGVLCNP